MCEGCRTAADVKHVLCTSAHLACYGDTHALNSADEEGNCCVGASGNHLNIAYALLQPSVAQREHTIAAHLPHIHQRLRLLLQVTLAAL